MRGEIIRFYREFSVYVYLAGGVERTYIKHRSPFLVTKRFCQFYYPILIPLSAELVRERYTFRIRLFRILLLCLYEKVGYLFPVRGYSFGRKPPLARGVHSARNEQRVGTDLVRLLELARFFTVIYHLVSIARKYYFYGVGFLADKFAYFEVFMVIRIGYAYPCVYLAVSVNL